MPEPLFKYPVSDPISALYGEPGAKYEWHIDEDSGIWIKGRQCCVCKVMEPCACLTPKYLGNHPGLDFSCPEGTMVRAVCDGLIVKAGPDDPIDEKQGKRVVQIVSLIGYDFWWLRYRHLRQPIPHPGYRVKQGDPIGYSGKNGESYLCVELLDPKGQYHPIPFHES